MIIKERRINKDTLEVLDEVELEFDNISLVIEGWEQVFPTEFGVELEWEGRIFYME